MSNYTKFKEIDLPRGKAAELEFGKILAERSNTTFVHKDDGKKYDFILRGKKDITVECKLQDEAKFNIFLEIECRGNPSGLKTTEANYWLICLPQFDELLLFRPKDALTYCKLNKINIVRGGDELLARGYTLNIKRLKRALNHRVVNLN